MSWLNSTAWSDITAHMVFISIKCIGSTQSSYKHLATVDCSQPAIITFANINGTVHKSNHDQNT